MLRQSFSGGGGGCCTQALSANEERHPATVRAFNVSEACSPQNLSHPASDLAAPRAIQP